MVATITQDQKVFLVDDDQEIRSTLSRALEMRGYKVETFDSAMGFFDSYDRKQSGCVILDYGMPEMNGLELQQLLTDQGIKIPVIFVSGHGGIPESVQAIKGGAIDFLEKPFRQNVLIECIEKAFEQDDETRAEAHQIHVEQQRFHSLTEREEEIAKMMVNNPSNTSSKDVGRLLDISPRTVDHHRARILEKLDIKSVAELIDIAPDHWRDKK